MSDNPTFKIYFRVYGELRRYELTVEQFYSSDQVLRFRIIGKTRSIEMEKQLLKKTNQWKIITQSLNITDIQKSAEFILRCQQCIDRYLKGPEPPRINNKNQPWNMPE